MSLLQSIGNAVSAGSNAVFGGLSPFNFLSPLVNGFSSLAQIGLGFANYKQNSDIAQQNLQLQQDKFEYDKALQQQIFEREDTAYQRTVNDMRSAGLSPLNMSGQNGAGSVVSTSAPQRQTQSATDAINSFNNVFNNFATMQQTLSSIKNSQKQNELLQTEINSNNLDNSFKAIEKNLAIKDLIKSIALKDKDLKSFDSILSSKLALELAEVSSLESSASLNSSLKQKEDDYNSLHDLRKSILDYDKTIKENESVSSLYDRISKRVDSQTKERNYDFKNRFGITDDMPPMMKLYALALGDSNLFEDYTRNKKGGKASDKVKEFLQHILGTNYDAGVEKDLNDLLGRKMEIYNGWF